jgi:hypothetical protein
MMISRNLGDDCTQPHLTREDYEKSLNTQQLSIEGEERDYTDLCSYQEETDMIMAEVQPRYNLRSKGKPISTTQPKKILPRGQTYEPTPEETVLPNSKEKVVNTQEVEVEKVETKTQETEAANTNIPLTKIMSNKVVQTNKLENKDSKVPTREIDKVSGVFIFKNEINKIKIPIPLVELVKNPVY